MRRIWLILSSSLLVAAAAFAGSGGQAGRYLEVNDYLRQAFGEDVPELSTLWVTGELREAVEDVLGHRFGTLRTRYWFDGETSAWVLDEIGKELPITIGVTVREDAIVNVRVLEFRESRGWEVRYPFFTDQFENARLENNGRLNRDIDSITGATLSVNAVTRVARVALLLHDTVADSG